MNEQQAMAYATAEMEECHKLLDRLDAPRQCFSEQLTPSQRLALIVRKYEDRTY